MPVILVSALLCLMLCPYSIKSSFFKTLMQSRENYKKEIEIINKNNAEEKEKTLDAVKRHQENLTKIENDFEIKMDELPKKEKKEVEGRYQKI